MVIISNRPQPHLLRQKIAQEVPGDSLGNEWKGYIFRITGGNEKQGFLMKQGVLLPYRVCLLLDDGHLCYRTHRVEYNVLPKRLGHKRATKIRSFFNLGKEDDVMKYVLRRKVKRAKKEDAKPYTKPAARHLHSLKGRHIKHEKDQKAEFMALLSKRVAEKKAKLAAIKADHKTTT
ncbi:hypothetical protein H0H87_003115 [Tephrocybe sp. NHM501043]|nr:hypothetical protein H0H87_003115 [Tephrocybe sp. NHM501043]